MRMDDFLKKLERQLQSLPPKAREEILAEYKDHFLAGRERGRTDEDIAARLGAPQDIARSFAAERHLSAAESSESMRLKLSYGLRAIVTLMGIGIFNAMFIAIPFFFVVLLFVAGWSGAAAVILTSLTLIASAFADITFNPEWTLQGKSLLSMWIGCESQIRTIACLGGLGTFFLGMIVIAGMALLSKWFIQATLRYARFNIKLLSNGERS